MKNKLINLKLIIKKNNIKIYHLFNILHKIKNNLQILEITINYLYLNHINVKSIKSNLCY